MAIPRRKSKILPRKNQIVAHRGFGAHGYPAFRPKSAVWLPQIRGIRHSAAAPCWPRSLAPRLAPFLPASHQLVCQLSALLARANLVFWKMRSRATTTFWSSSPRHSPRGPKLGSLRPQCPQTYPQNFQPLKIVPITTRSRNPRHPGYCTRCLGNSPG